MRLVTCLLLALLTDVAWAGEPVALTGVKDVQDLEKKDVDGDGITDLLLIEGRKVSIWRGRKGRLPDAVPTWTATAPANVSFVAADRRKGNPSVALLGLGTDGLQRIPLDGSKTTPPPLPESGGIDWQDADKVTFADMVRGGVLLLPQPGGSLYDPGGKAIRLEAPLNRKASAPGPFLEDTCEVTMALPQVFVGASAVEKGAGGTQLWALSGRSLVAQGGRAPVRYDLTFLPRDEEWIQRLVDLTGDGRPEVLHRIGNNREGRYGFFLTRPVPGAPTDKPGEGPSHKPALTDIYLAGFQLDPELVDLDGDGYVDMAVTTIAIDAANTLRAVTTGKVTAQTRAFLNRWKKKPGTFFPTEADASIKSDMGIKVRFNHAGVLEVKRSFTILVKGDYDGDGRKDLLIRTGPQALTVRRGVAAGVWEAEGRQVAIPPTGGHPDVEGYVADLTGDGRDDVVLIYRKVPGGRDRVWVLSP